ncbi:MAG: glutamate-5-semialdehyde dehydrogenase [Planctomycetota bacterium]
MTIQPDQDLNAYCLHVARQARCASVGLAQSSGQQRNGWLRATAQLIRQQTDQLLAANQLDLDAAPGYGLTPAEVDRLTLSPARLAALAEGVEQVATLPDPIGEVMSSSMRPNGLQVLQVRVPLGVVFFIYESRPNVTVDAAAICVKSGNSVILRGGKEARHSSAALVQLMKSSASEFDLPAESVQLVSTTDRAAIDQFLSLSDQIDVAIPRGGSQLIQRVTAAARMPVIKHDRGNCHVYVDATADLDMAERIVMNAKCQRMGVCNAAESLLVHRYVAPSFLPRIARALLANSPPIELRIDESCKPMLAGFSQLPAATEEDFFAEYCGPVLSVKVVNDLDAAIQHINHYGSHHTDAIVTRDVQAARRFTAAIDSSAVMVNASTRFNDGYEFGLGAEIGISTDKFHARGPCGLKELTSYKYIAWGDGHVRG